MTLGELQKRINDEIAADPAKAEFPVMIWSGCVFDLSGLCVRNLTKVDTDDSGAAECYGIGTRIVELS